MKRVRVAFLLLFTVLLARPAAADTRDPIKELPSRVKKITLKNGMRVLIMERPSSPTVSFAMFIRTGGIDDLSGQSGLAHMFEHMLFKGTKTIGTKDYEKEKPLLDELDRADAALQAELDRGALADPERVKKLRDAMEEVEKRHQALIVEEEFWRIYEQAGGQGMNASTGFDFTNYVISLPVNRVKLWMVMESDRLKNPVLREFYKERSVVMEERRLRIDNAPQGKLWEGFLATAFMAHPYGRPIVGWESDISRVNRRDAEAFFKQHYDVSRFVLGVVGGVKTEEIEAMMRRYFEPIPSRVRADEQKIPIEPAQQGERRVEIEFDAEPSILIGYHRPNIFDKDDAALEVASDVLSSGRTSRFYRSIVERRRIGVSAWANSISPGERDPGLFVMGGSPRAPHTARDLEAALLEEVEKLKKDGPTELELEKVKNNWEADMVRNLSSNAGMADQLAYYEAIAGDWQWLTRHVDRVRAVTAADVQRVAKQYLTPSNRTVGTLVRKARKP